MLHHSKVLGIAVGLCGVVCQLHGWQTTSGQQEQLSTTKQAQVDEFDAAVARCVTQMGEIADADDQSELFLELAMIHHRLERNEDAERFLKRVERTELSGYNKIKDFDYLQPLLKLGVSEWLKSLDARALEFHDDEDMREYVYLDAIQRCPSELGKSLVEKLSTDFQKSAGYSYLVVKEIRNGNQIQAEVLMEHWLTHGIAAYRSYGGEVYVQFEILIDNLVDEDEIDRARRLSQQVFDFAIKENQLQALWVAEDVAGRSGMPELAQKARQRIEEFEALHTASDERPCSSDYHAALASARHGNYKPAMKFLEACDEPNDYFLRSAIVCAMVKDEKAELALEFGSKFNSAWQAINTHLDIAKVANRLGEEAAVKKSLAICRKYAFDQTENPGRYFEEIAHSHFRFGEAEVCAKWIETITDGLCKSRALMGEVKGRFSQISK